MITEIDPTEIAAVSGGMRLTGIPFQPVLEPQGFPQDDPLNADTPNG